MSIDTGSIITSSLDCICTTLSPPILPSFNFINPFNKSWFFIETIINELVTGIIDAVLDFLSVPLDKIEIKLTVMNVILPILSPPTLPTFDFTNPFNISYSFLDSFVGGYIFGLIDAVLDFISTLQSINITALKEIILLNIKTPLLPTFDFDNPFNYSLLFIEAPVNCLTDNIISPIEDFIKGELE